MQESERGGRINESLEREKEGRSILEVGIQSSGFEDGTVEGCFPRSRWCEEGGGEKQRDQGNASTCVTREKLQAAQHRPE